MVSQILLVILLVLAWIGARSLWQRRERLLAWYAQQQAAPDRREGPREQPDAQERAPRRRGEDAAPEEMVECAHCGVFLARREALRGRGGRLYCSDEHRRQGPRA
ncbi:PP0621 family protein [Halorhodospira neutriphila]|uniref:PP0621 family protein n=1 Tax=Halorhodospira neutriphila TaxID=168379 RepID=UPI00190425B2|nr:PP0621 family protein [Halorhodospira neutriphila]